MIHVRPCRNDQDQTKHGLRYAICLGLEVLAVVVSTAYIISTFPSISASLQNEHFYARSNHGQLLRGYHAQLQSSRSRRLNSSSEHWRRNHRQPQLSRLANKQVCLTRSRLALLPKHRQSKTTKLRSTFYQWPCRSILPYWYFSSTLYSWRVQTARDRWLREETDHCRQVAGYLRQQSLLARLRPGVLGEGQSDRCRHQAGHLLDPVHGTVQQVWQNFSSACAGYLSVGPTSASFRVRSP